MSGIKNIRIQLGIKQSSAAEHLGLNQETLSRYENGQRELPPMLIKPLAALYGVPVEQIVDAAYPAKES